MGLCRAAHLFELVVDVAVGSLPAAFCALFSVVLFRRVPALLLITAFQITEDIGIGSLQLDEFFCRAAHVGVLRLARLSVRGLDLVKARAARNAENVIGIAHDTPLCFLEHHAPYCPRTCRIGASAETGNCVIVFGAPLLPIIKEIDSGAVGNPGLGAAQSRKTIDPATCPPAGTNMPRGGGLPIGAR